MKHIPSPIAFHLRAVREWMRAAGLPALVIQSEGQLASPARPILLCPHCGLPGAPHGPCVQRAEEGSNA